ncbi:hypothetical protein H0H81_010047 [Sphagnurus paluster]|uniref:Crinkler effector protein N-terminal domain-containing protein n=1 Tax=Sphagnurus paluster TaxID=117069 RepID=A0A9P7FW03_9AGAR|nr:hypothetical protein H0H81_010047 [Sphagnurus paluster]
MSQLHVSCLVHGSSHIFTIVVTPTARLSELRELAWTRKQHLFPGLHQRHLALWKVPFDVTEDDASVDNIQLVDGEGGVTKLTEKINTRIGSAIEFKNVESYLIVIQPPPKLWCWVHGLPKDTAFELQPFPDHKVSDLKEAIKEKMKPQLDDVPASSLDLWKTYNFHTEDFAVDLQDGIAGVCRLHGGEQVSSIFPNVVPGHRLSIIIDAQRLLPSMDTTPRGLPQELVDIVKKRLDISRERRENHPGPPSTLGEPANFANIQKSDKTYFGCARPLERESRIPLTLIHPIFGTFIDDSKEIPLGADDYKFSKRFRDDMCEFYRKEDDRRQVLCNLLNEFGLKVTPAHIGSSQGRTDGHIVTGKNHLSHIQELQNELGSGRVEPLFRALLYYQTFIDQFQLGKDPSTCHPCFIIAVLGPTVVFAGAALTDRANMEIFSTLPLNFDTANDELFDTLARHLAALKRGIASLETYYKELDQGTLRPADIPQASFPYPTSFDNLREETVSSLTYDRKLAGRRLVFKGSIDKGKKPVCIKFVRHYGDKVHHWCAEKGIAPDLIGFQKLPGGWYLVIMEFLEEPWQLLWQLKRLSTISEPEILKERLRAALVEMHQKHMVHGDIRDTNVMLNMDVANIPRFMILDFDWAGQVGEVKYPKLVNRQPELRRPDGVEDGKVILPVHDTAMVDSIFQIVYESSA